MRAPVFFFPHFLNFISAPSLHRAFVDECPRATPARGLETQYASRMTHADSCYPLSVLVSSIRKRVPDRDQTDLNPASSAMLLRTRLTAPVSEKIPRILFIFRARRQYC